MTNNKRIVLLLMLLLSAILACDSAPNKPMPRNDYTYQLTGVALADYDRDLAQTAVSVMRDSEWFPSATVRLVNDTLTVAKPAFAQDSLYYLLSDHAASLKGSNLSLMISDSTFATGTFPVSIPDTFTILTVEPPNRIVTGLQPVSVSWSGATGADGYILATVRRPYHHTGTGWSSFVTSMSPAGTIPPDAFSLSPGPNPDTGWYYIYVYAYKGKVDSSFARLMLPVPIPALSGDNVADDPFSGRIGTALITRRDSVHVVIQP